MKLVTGVAEVSVAEVETLLLSDVHADYLEHVSKSLNPGMPAAFGWPYAIRAILDRIEQSGIDLTAATNEQEIAALAAGELRGHYGRRGNRVSERFSSCRATLREDRPASRANRPGRGRSHSGKPPRSDRG